MNQKRKQGDHTQSKDALRALFPFFLKNALDSRARRFLRKKEFQSSKVLIRFFAKIASDNLRKNFGKKAAQEGPNRAFYHTQACEMPTLGGLPARLGTLLHFVLIALKEGMEWRERREGYTVVALAPGCTPRR